MSLSQNVLEAARWRAVQQRDKTAHSSFIYAVLTTRIFCRPTCPARLARRANVAFFDSAADATKAGFRACKRCKPGQQDLDADMHGTARTVYRACELIKAKEGHVSISEVAEHVGISVRHLYGLFRKVVRCSPAAYALRVREAETQLESKNELNTFEVGDRFGIPLDYYVDYGSPSSYMGMEMWTWDDEHDLLALTESCDSEMSPHLLTPVFTGSPMDDGWIFPRRSEVCRPDAITMEVHGNSSLDIGLNHELSRE